MLLKSVQNKNIFFIKLHKNCNEIMLKNYKNYCNTLKRTIKAAKRNHYKEAVVENKNTSSDLWKIINKIENFKTKKKKSQQS